MMDCLNCIEGQWIASEPAVELVSPATEQLLARRHDAGVELVRRATEVASQCHRQGHLRSAPRRSRWLAAIGEVVLRHEDELARLLVAEVGKTIREARAEVQSAQAAFVLYGEEAKRLSGELVPVDANPGSEGKLAFTIRVPAGPVLGITPFNAPLNQAAHKIGSALAAGCPIVLKPSPRTPVATTALVRWIFDEVPELPRDALTLLQGDVATGQALVESQAFARYMFTGSLGVGLYIKAHSGVRPVVLELGSNAPVIVCADADLEAAAKAVAASGYAIAGQVCTSVQRVLVQESVFDAFSETLKAVVERLVVGDPFAETTDMGPMISEEAAARAESWLTEAVSQGARVVTGGTRRGRWFAPTVLVQVQPEMRIVCQEVFAPVVSLMPFATLDDAIAAANATNYGLQCGLFTRDIDIVKRAARELEYGGIMVNDASRYRVPNQPYGGVKDSGLGREGGKYSVWELTDLKTVVIS